MRLARKEGNAGILPTGVYKLAGRPERSMRVTRGRARSCV